MRRFFLPQTALENISSHFRLFMINDGATAKSSVAATAFYGYINNVVSAEKCFAGASPTHTLLIPVNKDDGVFFSGSAGFPLFTS